MNKLIKTNDNSPTVFSERFNQTYHSIHGAIAESLHVFIQHGLKPISEKKHNISIFEMGFGTGLNAALTWEYAMDNNLSIHYISLEKFPLSVDFSKNYQLEIIALNQKLIQLHELEWNTKHSFPHFQFTKYQADIAEFSSEDRFDLIYYDAFAPNAQPELWTEFIFQKMYEFLNPNGILTTYCAKGEVKRNLKKCGFRIESPPGPIGKREMTVALKEM